MLVDLKQKRMNASTSLLRLHTQRRISASQRRTSASTPRLQRECRSFEWARAPATPRASAAPAVVVAILTLTYIFSFVHLLGKSFYTKYTRNMSRESARQMMRETMKGLRVAQSKL
eukprot:COSAG02_NODE_59_length_43585_cov_39.087752_3_plen_116_part_00